MSQRPSATAVIPEPEPVGLYVTEMDLFSLSKVSFSAPITFSIEVEPSVDTVPPVLPQPVSTERASTPISPRAKIFFPNFILHFSFSFHDFHFGLRPNHTARMSNRLSEKCKIRVKPLKVKERLCRFTEGV